MPSPRHTPTRASVFFAILSLGVAIGLNTWGEPFPEAWGVVESSEDAPPAEGIGMEHGASKQARKATLLDCSHEYLFASAP